MITIYMDILIIKSNIKFNILCINCDFIFNLCTLIMQIKTITDTNLSDMFNQNRLMGMGLTNFSRTIFKHRFEHVHRARVVLDVVETRVHEKWSVSRVTL